MRAFEILNETDRKIQHHLKKYYEMKKGRTSIGWNSYYKKLNKIFIANLSEHFLDPEIEEVIAKYIKSYVINNPTIAVDIISGFGEHQQELMLYKRDIQPDDFSHDVTNPESASILFNSNKDAEQFIEMIKLTFGGGTDDTYNVVLVETELSESIDVSTDSKELWELLSPHLNEWSKLTDTTMPFIEQATIISNDLNDLLDDRRITFRPDMNNAHENYVATGDIIIDTGYITIDIDGAALEYGEYSLTENPELWLKTLIKTITHELLHREQISRSNVHLKGTDAEVSDENEHKMLSNKHELQAWAKDAVDQLLRYPSVNTTEDIREVLRTGNGIFDSEAIRRYHENFVEYSDSIEDKRIWNRFMKYVAYYADRIE